MERLTLDEAIKYIKEVVCKNRKNKEKNTIVIPNSFISSDDCAEKYEQVAKWLKELKSYKEAYEQGLLVRLPCKVGEKLWCIVNSTIRELRVHHFDMPAFGTTDIVFRYADGFKLERFVGEIGKTVFLTREEAEKKLEEMKNE